MRVIMRFFILLSLLLVAMPHAASALNIGVVDMQRVMADAKAANSARDQLEAKQKVFKDQLTRTEADLQKKNQELVKQRSLLAAEQFKAKQSEFLQDASAAQKDVQDKRLKLRRAFEMSIVTIQKQVTSIVEKIAKERNLEMVLPSAQAIYFAPNMDITQQVLSQLDAQLPSLQVDFN